MTETTTEIPRLTRRQAAKIRTADKVLEAARHHFSTVGWEKGTIRAIAKQAGMSTGAVFANYDSKAVLYRAAMGHDPITPEQGARAILELKRALGEDSTDYADAILRIFEIDVPEEQEKVGPDGVPWRRYVKGENGVIVDVTHL